MELRIRGRTFLETFQTIPGFASNGGVGHAARQSFQHRDGLGSGQAFEHFRPKIYRARPWFRLGGRAKGKLLTIDYAQAAEHLHEAQQRVMANVPNLDWGHRHVDEISPPTFRTS